jgi:HSP20 family protein
MLTVKTLPAFRLGNESFQSFFNEVEKQLFNGNHTAAVASQVPANVIETEDAYHLELLAPGRKKDLFELKVEDQLLTIAYNMTENEPAPKLKKVRSEFAIGSFKRSFNLHDQVNAEAIQAKYEDGILKVWLPKKVAEKPTALQIAIQ